MCVRLAYLSLGSVLFERVRWPQAHVLLKTALWACEGVGRRRFVVKNCTARACEVAAGTFLLNNFVFCV